MEANLLLFKTVIAGDSHLTKQFNARTEQMIQRTQKRLQRFLSSMFFEMKHPDLGQSLRKPWQKKLFLASDPSPPNEAKSRGFSRAWRNTKSLSRFWVIGPLTFTSVLVWPKGFIRLELWALCLHCRCGWFLSMCLKVAPDYPQQTEGWIWCMSHLDRWICFFLSGSALASVKS